MGQRAPPLTPGAAPPYERRCCDSPVVTACQSGVRAGGSGYCWVGNVSPGGAAAVTAMRCRGNMKPQEDAGKRLFAMFSVALLALNVDPRENHNQGQCRTHSRRRRTFSQQISSPRLLEQLMAAPRQSDQFVPFGARFSEDKLTDVHAHGIL